MEAPIESFSYPDWNSCARDCLECFEACMRCLSHCLEGNGHHLTKKHFNLLIECQGICQLTASVLHLRTDEARYFCELCARICNACADACEESGDISELKGCAYHCRGCADSCKVFISLVS